MNQGRENEISRRGFTQPKIEPCCRFQNESFIHFVGSSGSGGYSATSGDADSGAGGSGYFPGGADDEGNGAAHIQHTGTAIVAAVVAAKLIM